MKKSTFFAEKLDWTSRGYSASPTPADDPERAADRDAPRWEQLEAIVEQAKRGDFSGVPRVLDLYPAGDALFRFTCCKVLGDAGTPACFERMLHEMHTEVDPEKSLDFIRAFHERGRLSDVPVIVDEYDKFHGFESANVLPMYLSDLLEREWGPVAERPSEDDLDSYEAMVLERHKALKEQLGNDDVVVRHGAVFSVARLARRMLERLAIDHETAVFHYKSRRLFEANTGIDCSSFYKNGGFQPLQAAVLLERFLQGVEAARYEDGVRYFFGHRIPD